MRSWWDHWIVNLSGEALARWTSSSLNLFTQKRSKWFVFPSPPWLRTQTDTRAQCAELSLPKETLRSLLTQSNTSNHQLHKPSAFSWGKERIMSCTSTRRSSSRRERRFLQVQGGGKTHNSVISINFFSGCRKMLSHSSEAPPSESGHE